MINHGDLAYLIFYRDKFSQTVIFVRYALTFREDWTMYESVTAAPDTVRKTEIQTRIYDNGTFVHRTIGTF